MWEANLRNGGQPPPRVEKTTPWGSHTPASNIGGTWGVDDDVGDNVWNPQGQWPSGPNQPQPPLWAGTPMAYNSGLVLLLFHVRT